MHSKGPTYLMWSSSVAKPPPTRIMIWFVLIISTPAYVPIKYLHLSGEGFSSKLSTGKSASKVHWSSPSVMMRRYSNFSSFTLYLGLPSLSEIWSRILCFSSKYSGLLTRSIFSCMSWAPVSFIFDITAFRALASALVPDFLLLRARVFCF